MASVGWALVRAFYGRQSLLEWAFHFGAFLSSMRPWISFLVLFSKQCLMLNPELTCGIDYFQLSTYIHRAIPRGLDLVPLKEASLK